LSPDPSGFDDPLGGVVPVVAAVQAVMNPLRKRKMIGSKMYAIFKLAASFMGERALPAPLPVFSDLWISIYPPKEILLHLSYIFYFADTICQDNFYHFFQRN
jgi:hypothetical protein